MRKIKILLLLFVLLIASYTVYAFSIDIILPDDNVNIGPVNTAGYPLYSVNVTVDSYANVTLLNVSINGVEVCSNNTVNLSSYICTWNVSLTGEGIYTVIANATNSTASTVGNFSSNVTIDSTNASMVLNFPANNANVSGTVNFNWTATDNYDVVLRCNLTIDSKVNTTVNSINNTATNFSVFGLTEGTHAWNVTCFDNALNSNTSETYSFVIDNTAPTINLTYPPNGTSSTSITFNFNWTATDNLATQTLCNLTIDSSIRASNVASPNGTGTNYSFSGLNLGAHYWNVTCIDPAGNSNTSETFLLTITSPPPPGGSSGGGNSAARFYTQIISPAINITEEETFMTVHTYSFSRINIDSKTYDLRISRILDDKVEFRIGNHYFRVNKNDITAIDLDFDNNDDLSMKITDVFFNKVNMILKSLATVEETKEVVDLREDKEIEEYTSSGTEKIQKAEEEIAPLIIPSEIKESKVSTIAMIIAILAIIAVFIFIYFKYSKPTKKKTLRF